MLAGIRNRLAYANVTATIAVCAVGGVLLAPSASAGVVRSGGIDYVTKGFELPPGKAKTFKAPCPRGKHVLGGGHYNSGSFGAVIANHSYPYDGDDSGAQPDDGWAAQLRGFTQSRDVKLYATCATILPEYERYTLPVPAGDDNFDEFDCDLSSQAILGGGSKGHRSTQETESVPSDTDEWVLAAKNNGALDRDITVFAICAVVPVTFVSAAGNADPVAQAVARAQCPPDASHVISGGIGAGSDDAALAATRPIGIGPGVDSWEGWLDNYDADFSDAFAVTGVCSAGL